MTPETPENPPTETGIDLELLKALLANQPKPMAWAEFVASIDCLYAPPLHAKPYHRRFVRACEKLAELGVKTTFDLTPQLILNFVAARPAGQQPWTLRGALTDVRTICNHAVRKRCLFASPFAVVPIGQIVHLGKPRGKRFLSRAEIARLMEVLRNDIATKQGWEGWKARRLYVVVCLGLYCGLRKMELLRLEVADIDLDARLIRLTPHGPTGKFKTLASEAPVPIPEALAPILEDWLRHRLDCPRRFSLPAKVPWLIPACSRKMAWTSGPHGGSRPLARLKAAAGRAGIAYITMHMLRRSCAIHLEAMGVPRSMISRILRHATEKVTEEFYLGRDEAIMVDAVKGLAF